MAKTERWREFRHAGKLKLAGLTLVVLYATPFFFYGVAATQRGHQEDNGYWLLEALAKRARAKRLGLWRACPRTVYDPYRGIETLR